MTIDIDNNGSCNSFGEELQVTKNSYNFGFNWPVIAPDISVLSDIDPFPDFFIGIPPFPNDLKYLIHG